MKQTMRKVLAVLMSTVLSVTLLTGLKLPNRAMAEEGIAINEMNFPDENFRAFVKTNYDTLDDGILSDEEIAAVTDMYCGYQSISDLTGIEYFTSMKNLFCWGNTITSLSIRNNSVIEEIQCTYVSVG